MNAALDSPDILEKLGLQIYLNERISYIVIVTDTYFAYRVSQTCQELGCVTFQIFIMAQICLAAF